MIAFLLGILVKMGIYEVGISQRTQEDMEVNRRKKTRKEMGTQILLSSSCFWVSLVLQRELEVRRCLGKSERERRSGWDISKVYLVLQNRPRELGCRG